MPDQATNRSQIYLGLGFLLLAAAVVATLWLVAARRDTTRMVQQSLLVEYQLSNTLSTLEGAETGERGYIVTGDPVFLEPYNAATIRLRPTLDQLGGLTAGNPSERRIVDRLRPLSVAILSEQRDTIEMRAHSGLSGMVAQVSEGKAMMDRARALVAAMHGEEEAVLAGRRTESARYINLITLALAILFLGIVALATFAVTDSRRRLREAVAARDELAANLGLLEAEVANREAAEAQVRQMQKMESIGQLTGGIAHDFNNMLAIVLGSLEMALRRIEDDKDRAVACINSAMVGAQRAAQLTARLLAFSRQQPLEPRPVDCNRLIGGMSDMLGRTIGDTLRMETILGGGLWRAHVDPSQLENALLNLCVNSRDAMPEGGKLTIETSNGHLDDAYAAAHSEVTPGQYVVVAVSDTGSGMRKETADRAFDPFFTTKGVGRGTGLGLSQVYGFIKQSRGHVKIYSEPDHGTTVKLYLPRYFGEVAESPAVARDAEAVRARDSETILVVEDEEAVRHMTVETLREFGYLVLHAPDARQALALVEMQPHIDLLFTDVVMPDMNGRRLAEEAQRLRPDLKVVYTTGYTRNAVIHNGMLDPGVAFLPKPFSSNQLAVKIRQVLDGGGINRPLAPEPASASAPGPA